MSEEELMQIQEDLIDDEYVCSYPNIPYFLLENDIDETKVQKFKNDFRSILKYYKIYKRGATFIPEGFNGHYNPSKLKYRKASMIMKKEARFLFSNPPTFNVNVDDVKGDFVDENAIIQDYLDKVFEKTKFHSKLLKGLKDCFIGKRVAIVVNFNIEYGISITFLNALEFFFELDGNSEELSKFTSFYESTGNDDLTKQRWYKKSYSKEEDGVYLEEGIYDGTGERIENVIPRFKIKFSIIPAVIILNDGLTGDLWGESELENLIDFEKYYSKLANSDMDSERKGMHPTRYTIDASERSTTGLSTSPGSYWDLQTDTEKPVDTAMSAKVGLLEPQLSYSAPLKTTLDRIENQMYNELDVPNISSEQLAGVITSGKTIQALYWGLTVRCDEKMLAWGPELSTVAYLVIEGGRLYPECISKYTKNKIPNIPYDVVVENNYPIPEDVKEEKELDIAEVEGNIMSRKYYMKKWRKLNDREADEELEQIQKERELLENSYIGYSTDDTVEVDNGNSLTETVINQRKQVDNESKLSEKS